MIWAEVALSAGAWLSGDRYRTSVPRVAGGAITDCAVIMGFSDTVALLASTGHRRGPFQSGERMWRTFDASWLVSLSEIHLLGSKCFVPSHCGPRNRGVAAVQELLIDVLMAATAVTGSEATYDGESVMLLTFLSIRRLMAIKAIDALLRVLAHFIFVNN